MADLLEVVVLWCAFRALAPEGVEAFKDLHCPVPEMHLKSLL